MNRQELIKVFLISFGAKYKNQFFKNGKEPEMSSPSTFKSKSIQRAWEGYQLCYDNFFKGETIAIKHQFPSKPTNHPTSELVLENDVEPVTNTVRKLNHNELSTVLINSTVSIIYQNKNRTDDQWIFKSSFMSLVDAVDLLNDMNLKGIISLDKWEPYMDSCQKQHFLVPNTGERKTHIWGGTDTLCRGWLNKAMKPSKYKLTVNMELNQNGICANCIAHITPTNLKANLKLGSGNRILEIIPK